MRERFPYATVQIEIANAFTRLDVMIFCQDQNVYCGDQVEKIEDYKGRLTVRSVKLVMDGALGSWGAAMLQVLREI